MKVFITKYALTLGIQETEGKECGDGMFKTHHGGYTSYFHKEGRDWHKTWESAAERAENMRKDKIASINKSLKKLEAMKFSKP